MIYYISPRIVCLTDEEIPLVRWLIHSYSPVQSSSRDHPSYEGQKVNNVKRNEKKGIWFVARLVSCRRDYCCKVVDTVSLLI